MAMRAWRVVKQVAARRSAVDSVGKSNVMLQAASMQAREMGIFSKVRDTVQQKMDDRNVAKQGEAYKEQMQKLATLDKFDLVDFHKQLQKQADDAGVNGFRSMLPGYSSMTEVQQMKNFLAILDAMDEEVKKNPKLVDGKFKRKFMQKHDFKPEDLSAMMKNFDQLQAMQMWLQKRVERGLHVPETLDETTRLMRADPTGFPTRKFRPKVRR